MVTSVWQSASVDTAWLGDQVFTVPNINIPAGGILKRFLLSWMAIQGRASNVGFDKVYPVQCSSTVDITAGQYSPRNIYRSIRRVPMDVVALYDSATFERVYTQYVCAGENELGADQRCSYGTHGGPGFTLRLQCHVILPPGALALLGGRVQFQLRTLHQI